MRVLVSLLCAAACAVPLATARADGFSAGLGVGATSFRSSTGDSTGLALQLRVDAGSYLSFDIGEDMVCTEPWCAVLGLYRVGVQVLPVRGSIRPYAYGRAGYFLHPAESDEGEHPPFDVGPVLGAGLGVCYRAGRVGVFVEGGVVSDRDGREVTERRAAVRGALEWRFGR